MGINKKLDEIQARCDAATEGPWRSHDFGYAGHGEPSTIVIHTGGFDWRDIEDHGESLIVSTPAWDYRENENARFIAAARTDLPAVAAALRAVLDLCDRGESVAEELLPVDLSAAEWGGAHAVRNVYAAVRDAIAGALA